MDIGESVVIDKIEDGGSIVLSCSNCDKGLAVIFITRPHQKNRKGEVVKWKAKAKCCYCGDFSFVKNFEGAFHYKGFDVPHPNGNPEDVEVYTNVTGVIISGDNDEMLLFETEKVK
jgi:hypothetical protein